MDTVTLPPDLEQFANEAVASGRFRDRQEMLTAAMGLLRQQEAARAAFVTSLEEAEAEGERDGFFTIDEVMREMDELIEKAERRRA
jgi:putative addiction module CopG family antidote